jgi:hypothetical protein
VHDIVIQQPSQKKMADFKRVGAGENGDEFFPAI